MIVNFKEKFSGDKKLIRISEGITGVLTVILWGFFVDPRVDKIYGGMFPPQDTFNAIFMATPVHVGYLLFYWAIISWIVYPFAKMRYKVPEIKG